VTGSHGDRDDTQIYSRVVDNIDRAVIAIDRQGRIVLFNPAAQACTGRSERQSVGRHFEELFAGQDKILNLLRSGLSAGRSISDDENVMLQRAAAPPLPVSLAVSPIYTDKGEQDGAVLIIRDLSRLRELEEAVRRADRLSMLGILAAGLAHEIKNPLGGIKGAAQLLAMELGNGSPLREYTGIMVKEVERVNGIIEELMDLARPRQLRFTEVNISKVLGDILLFQKEAHRGKRIEFVLSLDPSIPPIRGDENLLTRLFLNLIKNAAEAIEKHGRIEVSSKVASDYHLQDPGRRPVPMIQVEIRDDGRGIAAGDLENIFTPFYTTKDRGSGLGLATCQKIVDSHRGFLRVDSRVGEGTTFAVSLPLYRNTGREA